MDQSLVRYFAVNRIAHVVRRLIAERISSRTAWRDWAKRNLSFLNDMFEYPAHPGMPTIDALIRPDFHPTLPLVMFNYSSVAHNTLHAFEDGWSLPLRLCRGIIFDLETTTVVAIPFPKFFNDGEHPETRNLPDESWEATAKFDGHLGIIFCYRGKFHLTTRGDFGSNSGKIGRQMLNRYVRSNAWRVKEMKDFTILVEIIHPETRVHVDYAGEERFVLIGAYVLSGDNYEDLHGNELGELARGLGLETTPRWAGASIEELRDHMKNRSVRNTEGFVVRFESGLRVKFKYESYIGLMVAAKLSYRYLMQRMMSGNLASMVMTLDAEVRPEAERMIGRLILARDLHHRIADTKQREKLRRAYLHGLVPPEECTDYHKDVCRRFLRWLNNLGPVR